MLGSAIFLIAKRTEYTSAKSYKDAESFRIILNAGIRLEAFENAHDDGQNDDLANRRYGKWNVGDPVALKGLIFSMCSKSKG